VDTDVLIVGAGPVGLFLANECVRRGLRWRLVEANAAQSSQSRALAIFPRTLEILDMAGLVRPFMEVANRVTSVAVIAHGHTLTRVHFTPDETPYSFIAMVPQNVTERLLAERLHRGIGRIEYNTSFLTAIQHDDHVEVTLDRMGQRETLTTAFVVGCDGAHSAVRHLLEFVRHILRQRAPAAIEAHGLRWSSYFHQRRGTSMNHCGAARAFAAVSCCSSTTHRIRRSWRRRRAWSRHFQMSSTCGSATEPTSS
jgi:2-polyprenyl-6-methoxyphenol hydroxylase-like FAD-dependent oxidoreductase